MLVERLGLTDLDVSKLGFGTAPLGERFGPVEEAAAVAVVHEALDLGITFFDTAASYGNAEERLGKALVGRRDEVVVGTKAGRYGFDDFDFSPARIRRWRRCTISAGGRFASTWSKHLKDLFSRNSLHPCGTRVPTTRSVAPRDFILRRGGGWRIRIIQTTIFASGCAAIMANRSRTFISSAVGLPMLFTISFSPQVTENLP